MENFSTTQAGNIGVLVGLIVLILNHFKLNISSDEITQVIGAGFVIVSTVVSWVSRFRKGDVTIAGFRK